MIHTQILMQITYRHYIPKQRLLGVWFAARRDQLAAMIAHPLSDGVECPAFNGHGEHEQKWWAVNSQTLNIAAPGDVHGSQHIIMPEITWLIINGQPGVYGQLDVCVSRYN